MIFLHIVLAILLLMLVNGFVQGAADDSVSENAMIGLGSLAFITLLAFGLSFLK